MAEIAWWAWLGIGLFVAISSAVAGGKLAWFAWVGLVFIVIGIAKIVYLFVMKPKETKKEHAATRVHTQHTHMPQTPQAYYCPRCRVTVQQTDFFCRYCGTRLR